MAVPEKEADGRCPMLTWRKKSGTPAIASYPADRTNDFLEAVMQFGVFAPVLMQTWGPQQKRARGRRTS
jgi:hypothetical protein